jgi:hypothetical protein
MAQWDIGRFWRTLQYFGSVPFLGAQPWFQQLLGTQSPNPIDRSGQSSMHPILVAGAATSPTGLAIVRQLLARNHRVVVWGDRPALWGTDVNPSDSRLSWLPPVTSGAALGDKLPASLPADLRAAIYVDSAVDSAGDPVGNPATRAAGDGVGVPGGLDHGAGDRTPWANGLAQYWDQTAVGDRPAAQDDALTVFDFRHPTADLAATWGVLDDVVMGGVSESQIRFLNGAALFAGQVSTANSGGFVSVRTRNFERPLDLGGYDGIELRLKGDGNRYKLILRDESRWDGVGYCASFDTVYNVWITVRIPFDRCIPVFRARTLRDRLPLNPRSIYALQLMLSKFEYDGDLNPRFQPGSFALEVESIRAYGRDNLPRWVWLDRAGQPLPAALATAADPATVIQVGALTAEPGGSALALTPLPASGTASPVAGHLSRADAAQLCVQALDCSAARGVQVQARSLGMTAPGIDWNSLFATVTPVPTP